MMRVTIVVPGIRKSPQPPFQGGVTEGYTEGIKGKKVMLRPLKRHVLDEVATWPKYTGIYSCYNWREFGTREGRDRWYVRRIEGEPSSFWLSIHKLNGDLIGLLNIHGLKDDPWHREAEIGIGIRSDECGKGYGTDGLKIFANNIFEKTDLKHLGIGVRKWNERALRCYEKCGFARCGESTMMINGDRVRFIEMGLEKGAIQAFGKGLSEILLKGNRHERM